MGEDGAETDRAPDAARIAGILSGHPADSAGFEVFKFPMTARIFKPAKSAMQSGAATTKAWQLDYEPEQARVIEPLMGWTSSGDMKQQVTLRFDTQEDAIAYCEREGIAYQVLEPKELQPRVKAYADNFAFRRPEPWTH
jgi:hypothetical protein